MRKPIEMLKAKNDALKFDVNKFVTADVFKQNYNKLICDLKICELAEEYNLSVIGLYRLWNNHSLKATKIMAEVIFNHLFARI